PHPNAETQFGFPDAQVIRIRGLYLKIVLWPQLVIHYVATEAASQLKNRRSKADHLCGGSASVAKAGFVAQPLAPVKGCKTCNSIHAGIRGREIEIVKHVLGELRVLLSKNLIR